MLSAAHQVNVTFGDESYHAEMCWVQAIAYSAYRYSDETCNHVCCVCGVCGQVLLNGALWAATCMPPARSWDEGRALHCRNAAPSPMGASCSAHYLMDAVSSMCQSIFSSYMVQDHALSAVGSYLWSCTPAMAALGGHQGCVCRGCA